MIAAQFRIELPDERWIAEVSREFPDATFRLLTGLRTGDTAIELGDVTGADPDAAGDAIAAHPAISRVTRLGTSDDTLLVRYETTDVGFYRFVEATSLAPEFPFSVRDGSFEFDFTGTREDLERLRETLTDAGLPYELRSVVESTDSASLLTDRQREVLETAQRAGYFEVPREATLAEVAEELGVDQSTASGVLRRGQGRILTWYLTGAGGTTR